jgi:high-affinity K+ transport system ATPase subunit B
MQKVRWPHSGDKGLSASCSLPGSAEIAEAVAQKLALDECFSGVSPEGKLEIVGAERRRGLMMSGDGINDAPALALADVGVALGARGLRPPQRPRTW